MRSAFTFVLLIVGAAGMAGAQVADTSAFRRLDLPAPNAYRSAGGAPGHAYWQNRADYAIEATLDTVRNEIRATGRLHYDNNSPDALQFLWLQLDQNIFAEGSINQLTAPPPLVFAGVPFNMTGAGFIGGFTIDRLEANGRALPRYLWDTMLRVDLPSPLAPGEAITLDLAWRFPIPEMGAGRMGRDGRLYQIAQWYPRFAVYDDVNGWNTLPYIGAGEFYLEYGDFDVRLTVPASFIVAATGTLENPGEVLTEQQRVRLLQAQSGGEPVSIITADEAGNPARTRPSNSGTITWHFRASNVRDVAFACAPNFRWDATAWNGILVQTFYRPQAARWEEAIRMARHTIQFFSEQWATYPWPQFSTVEGPIQGMEYPMITFVPNDTSRTGLHWTLMHEFGHEWFPMMVGNDERRYPWMDEGFNTFIDLYAAADYFRGTPYADSVMNGPLTAYPANARPGDEQPLITAPTEVRTLYWNG
ncbi:MAG: M1 family metallopeptidase, partial [Gemmatimonadota bacterium]